MTPFRSAEFKDYIESLGVLGTEFDTQRLIRMYLSGELRSLWQQLSGILAEYEALRILEHDIARQIATQDAFLHREILYAEETRELLRTRNRVLTEAEALLAAEIAMCEDWKGGHRTDDRARQACDLARDMEALTIPWLYQRVAEAEDNLAALEASVEHNAAQLQVLYRRSAEIVDRVIELRSQLAPLGL